MEEEILTTPQDGTNPEPEIEVEEPIVDIEEEDVETLKQKLADAEEAKRQLTARAKKVEAENKALKGTKAEPTPPVISKQPVLSEDAIDERLLKSQGMSDELLEELKALAKVRGKSLLDTQSDPIFKTIKEAKEAEAKSQKAKLGASRGSGSVKKEKTFNTKGLTPEEHKQLWLESEGR